MMYPFNPKAIVTVDGAERSLDLTANLWMFELAVCRINESIYGEDAESRGIDDVVVNEYVGFGPAIDLNRVQNTPLSMMRRLAIEASQCSRPDAFLVCANHALNDPEGPDYDEINDDLIDTCLGYAVENFVGTFQNWEEFVAWKLRDSMQRRGEMETCEVDQIIKHLNLREFADDNFCDNFFQPWQRADFRHKEYWFCEA